MLFDTQPERRSVFSECEQYRYRWYRRTNVDNDRVCNFVMLNPSTADDKQDDNTTRRCVSFAERFDCGMLVVTNVFAFRATNPKVMLAAEDPVGPDNDFHLIEVANDASLIIAAWGGNAECRGDIVRKLLKPYSLHYLALTSKGQPRHPLYLKKDLDPIPFQPL